MFVCGYPSSITSPYKGNYQNSVIEKLLWLKDNNPLSSVININPNSILPVRYYFLSITREVNHNRKIFYDRESEKGKKESK